LIRGFGILFAATFFVAEPMWADEDYELHWSARFDLRLKDVESPVDDDDVTGFFDRYEFTRNKNNEPTIEFALSKLEFDLFGDEETPRLQFRLRSPTSDLNLSGQSFEIGENFLNQRAQLYARPRGLALDLDYRRFRTEELRLFNADGWISDLTDPDDRFFVRRSRIGGKLTIRPEELLTGNRGALGNFLSEVALRGGYEQKKGKRQTRSIFLANRTGELDQEVTRGGTGLVFSPGGLFTLAVDVDHERLSEHAAPDLLGLAIPDRTISFIPDTDRTTGTVRLNSRLGERAVVHGGLQISSLNQEGTRTPRQEFVGHRGNKVLFYSGNLATDVWLAEDVSLNAFLKFDNRRNRIEREPGLFDRSDGTQVHPFLKRIRRVVTGAEAIYRLAAMNRVALGVRGDWTDRELEYPSVCRSLPGGFSGICPAYSLVDDDTTTYTAYLRTTLRPLTGLQFSGEIGYASSPETGYIRELDDMRYGNFRASYTFPWKRPVTLSLFGRGEFGNNDDFTQHGNSGTSADREFDRDNFLVGGTLTAVPRDGITLFGSVYRHHDSQDYDLIFSNTTRSSFALGFGDFMLPDSELDYRADGTALILGGGLQITEHTDASLSYTFTRSNWRFQSDSPTTSLIDDLSRIRSDLHRAELEVGHWLMDGLRLSMGYRFDKYRDRTPVSTGTAVVAPFNLSTRQHTVIFGVTLNGDALP
jgi:hypothetical protein